MAARPEDLPSDEQLKADARQLLAGEFKHRIVNLFSVIQSMVRATARSHDEVETYRDALIERLLAFAATQTALAEQAWTSMALTALVDLQLKPHVGGGGNALVVEGEPLRVSGRAAQHLAMMLHELVVNAMQHGALTRRGGSIELGWRIIPGAGGPRFALAWIERGGPPVTVPECRGFGSVVLESSARALGGKATLVYAPEGVSCTIQVPAERVIATEQEPA